MGSLVLILLLRMNPTMKTQALDFHLNQTVMTFAEAHISKLTQANLTKVKCMWLHLEQPSMLVCQRCQRCQRRQLGQSCWQYYHTLALSNVNRCPNHKIALYFFNIFLFTL